VGILLLDACCVLNLYATDRMSEILGALPHDFAIAELVTREALHVRHPSGDPAQPRVNVDLSEMISQGLLDVLVLSTPGEQAAFVSYAAEIDDGEAMTCALAVGRGYSVATDDLKVTRLAKQGAMPAPIVSTPDLMKAWRDTVALPREELRQALRAIEARASFSPGKGHALRPWWLDGAGDV
jgi:predicted nucleic acid-binding protein